MGGKVKAVVVELARRSGSRLVVMLVVAHWESWIGRRRRDDGQYRESVAECCDQLESPSAEPLPWERKEGALGS